MRLASHDSCALIGNDGFRKFIGCSNRGSLFAGQAILRACHAEGAGHLSRPRKPTVCGDRAVCSSGDCGPSEYVRPKGKAETAAPTMGWPIAVAKTAIPSFFICKRRLYDFILSLGLTFGPSTKTTRTPTSLPWQPVRRRRPRAQEPSAVTA